MKLILCYSLIILFSSCIFEDPTEIIWDHEVYQSNIIIKSTNHLAFTDLIKFKDNWYVVYRESDEHVLGTFSKINVLRSNDFVNWSECNTYEKKGWDLRDPKFSLNECNDSLYLHIHLTNEPGTIGKWHGEIKENYYFTFDSENKSFEESFIKKLKNHNGKQNLWLWRPYWYGNELYVSAYNKWENFFYKFDKIDSDPIIIAKMYNYEIGETTFKVYNDRLYFLSRRKNDAIFGSLTADMDSISRINEPTSVNVDADILPIGQLGGPNMILHNNIAYIGGRTKIDGVDRTAIYKYSLISKEIELIATLESYGDNSYPGMFLINNVIYGIYYTQNKNFNGYEIKNFKIEL